MLTSILLSSIPVVVGILALSLSSLIPFNALGWIIIGLEALVSLIALIFMVFTIIRLVQGCDRDELEELRDNNKFFLDYVGLFLPAKIGLDKNDTKRKQVEEAFFNI